MGKQFTCTIIWQNGDKTIVDFDLYDTAMKYNGALDQFDGLYFNQGSYILPAEEGEKITLPCFVTSGDPAYELHYEWTHYNKGGIKKVYTNEPATHTVTNNGDNSMFAFFASVIDPRIDEESEQVQGFYSISFSFETSGDDAANPSIPQTGDESQLGVWLMLPAVSCAGMITLRKKKAA